MAPTWIIVVEHLDPELGPWSALEYETIAKESGKAGFGFVLAGLDKSLDVPEQLRKAPGFTLDHQSSELLFSSHPEKVCLLDPAANAELSPHDGDKFEIFLFGGILGDDPPRDRTSELRDKGFGRRRLGPVQMTTDTAARVTRMVIQEKIALDRIPYLDFPEIKIDAHESTEMPFRYVKDHAGSPVMPEGMVELIKQDADKGLDDLL